MQERGGRWPTRTLLREKTEGKMEKDSKRQGERGKQKREPKRTVTKSEKGQRTRQRDRTEKERQFNAIRLLLEGRYFKQKQQF